MSTPKKIGRYKVEGELGRGGMATVYRAYDPVFEREVAIKVLPREVLHDSLFRARFEREIKVVARLEHTAIVPVYDVGEERGVPYFVMRYMTGGSLSERLKSGSLRLEEAVRVLQRIAAGLDYAHGKGIIHRDLKPGNILFDEAGDPFIADFGIAKLMRNETNLTGDTIIGSPTYMSPEQSRGGELDHRSDIYALGVIIFEMLSGKTPYSSDTPLGMALKHASDPIPHIRDLRPELPVAVEIVLEKALAKKPDERFGSASAFASAMSEAMRGVAPDLDSTAMITTRRQNNTERDKRERFFAPFLLGLLVFVGALLAGWFVWSNGILLLPSPTATPLPPTLTASPTKPLHTPTASFTPTILATDTATSTFTPRFTSTATRKPTNTTPPTKTPKPTSTLTFTPEPPTATPTIPVLIMGGADTVAFLMGNNIWQMAFDGTQLTQLTRDGKSKSQLNWMPDGKSLVYLSPASGCARVLTLEDKKSRNLLCINGLEGFQIGPDGKQAVITANHKIFVVPYNEDAFVKATRLEDLAAMNGCLTYTRLAARWSLWSSNLSRLAVMFQLPTGNNKMADTISVLDISKCGDAEPIQLDRFPNTQFIPQGYTDNLVLPDFDWDGATHFLFNTFKRNDGYGELYLYDIEIHEGRKINPIDGVCCYRDARWSPDHKYIFFAFQDVRLGSKSQTLLYYIPFDEIGTGKTFEPIPLPKGFFASQRDRIQPALRFVAP